jgi:hypothetical protein
VSVSSDLANFHELVQSHSCDRFRCVCQAYADARAEHVFSRQRQLADYGSRGDGRGKLGEQRRGNIA